MIKSLFLVLIILIITINISFSYSDRWIWVDNVIIRNEGGWERDLNYKKISCADSMNCIAVGNLDPFQPCPINRITSDGGKTWFTTYADTAFFHGAPRPAVFKSVSYPDTNLCIIVGDSNYVWRSIDRCHTWTKSRINAIYLPNQDNNFDVKMYNTRYGCIRTLHEVFSTTDGGENWIKVDRNIPDSIKPSSLYDICVPEENVIIVLGLREDLLYYFLYTYDGGQTWNYFNNPGIWLTKIYFINRLNGWATGFTQYANSIYNHIIVHTTDGGATWEKQLDSLVNPKGIIYLKRIYMDNAGEYGVALSEQDILWKTSNGGNKWSIDTSCNFYNLNNNSWLIDIAFLSHSSFYALSSNRFIYKYFDINTDVGSNQLKEDNSNIEIYPNPCISGNKLSIKLFSDIPDIYSLSIFNSLGQKIETDYNTQFVSNFTLEFETTGLSIGIYFLSVKSKGRSIMKPFIIE